MQEYDVIICGAGPAGSTCALGLYNSGLSVALLDKHTFPREKICGDAYGGYAYKILNTISPEFGKQILALKEGKVAKRAIFVAPNGKVVNIYLKGLFTNLPRVIFDNFLLNMVKRETSTQLFENTTAKKVEITKEGVLLTTTDDRIFKAKVIVGCDGAHSVVQTALTHTREAVTETCPSLRGYFRNVKGVEDDCLEIHLLNRIPKGYFWIFPSTDGLANVGLGADKEVIAKHKINMRNELQNIIREEPQFKERFADAEQVGEVKGWTIPIGYFNGKLPISGNRVLLCGDAASLTDPATGEGIGPAMSSGRYAAMQIIECFKKNDFSAAFMKAYDRQIRNKYYRNYLVKSTFADMYYKYPFIANWFVYWMGKLNLINF